MNHSQQAASRLLTHTNPPQQAAGWRTNLARTHGQGHTTLASAITSSRQHPRSIASSPLAAPSHRQPQLRNSPHRKHSMLAPAQVQTLRRQSSDVPKTRLRVRASATAPSVEEYIAGAPADGAGVNGRAPGTGHIDDVAQAKARLAQALASVDRGVSADEEQRAIIEEAQVSS